jgi:hypothetical protein
MRGRNFLCLSLLTLLTVALEPAARADRDTQRKGLNFLVDTGASPTVLDRRLAQKLGLDELPASIAVVNGSVPAGRAIVPSLEFGPLRRDNFPIVVEDLSFFQKALPVPIDAVIGLDVLGQSTFEIDYAWGQIRFGALAPLANSLPLRIQAGLPIIDAELNHVAVHLLMDTAASSLILFEPKTPGPVLPTKVSAPRGSPDTIGEFERKQVWLRSLRLGEAEFGRESALVVRSPGDEERSFDGLMSPAALGMTKVAIDVERGVLAFSR